MADKRISELVVATSSLSTDELVIRRGFENLSLQVGLVSSTGSATTDTGSLVTTSSISGTTQTFTKGDGSTYTNEIVSASYAATSDTSALSSSLASSITNNSSSAASSLTNYSASHAVYLESNFIQTVNAVGPDADGNVGVSLTSVSTGLSSSFPATPTDGDVYVISGETATDRTSSNGQSFIYSDDSSDWFRLSGLDEAGNDARYVNVSGDTMTGNLFLNGDPTLANQASTKQYVDSKTAVGTNGQTIRFNGTTPTANSVLYNNGTNIGIGTTAPQEQLEIRRLVAAGNDNFALQLTNPLTVNDSRIGILFSDNTNTGAGRDGAAIQVTNSNVNGRGHMTFGPVQNMTMTEVMRITQDQKVGIGTDTPSTLLHVDGTGKFEGELDMTTNKVVNVTDPTSAQDAATKAYVDSATVFGSWTNVATFSNGWVNYGSGFTVARYTKIGDVVYLQGLIRNGTTGATAFTLPTGYRPTSGTLILPTLSRDTDTDGNLGSSGRIAIQADGQVIPQYSGVPARDDISTWFSLNVQFLAV